MQKRKTSGSIPWRNVEQPPQTKCLLCGLLPTTMHAETLQNLQKLPARKLRPETQQMQGTNHSFTSEAVSQICGRTRSVVVSQLRAESLPELSEKRAASKENTAVDLWGLRNAERIAQSIQQIHLTGLAVPLSGLELDH